MDLSCLHRDHPPASEISKPASVGVRVYTIDPKIDKNVFS